MAENPIFSYTKRDYENSRQEGLMKIPMISSGAWTDLNATDPGIIILDYVHALVDMVNYYQDHQALESFLSTAKERVNIFRLAKQLSYKVRSAKGAMCDVTFTSSFQYNHPVLIPKYTRVRTKDNIQYMTTEDAYLPTGEVRVVIPCMQGTFTQKIYTGTGISRFSVVEGASNQSVYLTSPNIDIDSISVVEKDSKGNITREWSPVDYIVFSEANERVYQLELTPYDSVNIKFGDGVRGVVPQETDVLTIEYIVTDAEEGKIGANAITELIDAVYDTDGTYIEFSVSNNQPSYGGSNIQSSSEIKEVAPGVIKSQYRAVTLSDFEYLAKLVSGVTDAKAYDLNTNPDLAYYEVELLVIPDSTSDDALSLINKVKEFITPKMIPPTNLQVKTPNRLPLDIIVSVQKYDNVVAERLKYSIHQSIMNYFSSRATAIGESFYPSDLAAIVKNIEGVRSVMSVNVKYQSLTEDDNMVEITDYSPINVPMNYIISLGSSIELVQ